MMSPAADPSHRPHSVNEWGYWACTMVHNHDKQTWPARLVAHPFAAAKRMLEDVEKDSHQRLPLPVPTPLSLDCNHQPRSVDAAPSHVLTPGSFPTLHGDGKSLSTSLKVSNEGETTRISLCPPSL